MPFAKLESESFSASEIANATLESPTTKEEVDIDKMLATAKIATIHSATFKIAM